MLNENEARQTIGTTAYSADGDKIGKVGQLFLDDQTGRPEFITVNTGSSAPRRPTSRSPTPPSTVTGSPSRSARSKVKDAPNVDAEGGHLDRAEEQRLYEYYGLQLRLRRRLRSPDRHVRSRRPPRPAPRPAPTHGTRDRHRTVARTTGTADRSLAAPADRDRLAGDGRTDGDSDRYADVATPRVTTPRARPPTTR